MEVVGHRMGVHKEVEVHRTVMDREVVEDGLAFDNVVADNIEAAECMAENIGAGNIVIGNIGAGIHSRSLKDSHHILADCNYID